MTHICATPDLSDPHGAGGGWFEIGGTAKARQDCPQSITADSIKGLGLVYESCIQMHALLSAFLLNPPQHEDHVCRPSVGSEPTLAFWRFFLCNRRNEPVQQHTSQDFACNGEWGNASVV